MAYNAEFFHIVLILLLSSFALVVPENLGVAVELIHRDSINSPFLKKAESPASRLRNTLQRSHARANRINKVRKSLSDAWQYPTLTPDDGDYLMKVSIGTPPQEVLAIADTGSDLLWVQCKTCNRCFEQEGPVFDPQSSSSYTKISCTGNTECQNINEGFGCDMDTNTCYYAEQFGDYYSYTQGDLARDRVTLGSVMPNKAGSLTVPNAIIGCGKNSEGNFDGDGIIGLGRSSISLISQMDSLIDGKFSYCLVRDDLGSELSSAMYFGPTSIVSGPEMVSTPLVSGDPDIYYFLVLEAISVGDKRLTFGGNSSPHKTEGNIIIDSGTTLTYLPKDIYSSLESEVKRVVDLEPATDPEEEFSACYRGVIEYINVDPIITMHFRGADVKLSPLNTFLTAGDDIICLAFGYTSGLPIYGNKQQMNFLVGYDLRGNTVSFMPTDCTKH